MINAHKVALVALPTPIAPVTQTVGHSPHNMWPVTHYLSTLIPDA